MASHRRDAVVENDRSHRRPVVMSGEYARHSGMEERRVAENGAYAALKPCFLHARRIAYGRAHADCRIHRI